MASTRTTARLEARISEDLHATLKRAAALQDQERFAAALLTPAKPNAALKRAFTRHRKLIAPT